MITDENDIIICSPEDYDYDFEDEYCILIMRDKRIKEIDNARMLKPLVGC
jgi:hypothetical protein